MASVAADAQDQIRFRFLIRL